MSQGRQLVIMGRAPVPGACKTRLIPARGEAGAADLYARLLHHTLSEASRVPGVVLTLRAHPDIHHPQLQAWAAAFGAHLAAQRGADLGERMAHALESALADGESAVLIGSDSPDYATAYLESAFAALEAGHPVVLGPAYDGGYVLIGLRAPQPELFRDIPWGSDQVAVRTRERAAELGLPVYELPPLGDIDHPEDIPPGW